MVIAGAALQANASADTSHVVSVRFFLKKNGTQVNLALFFFE